jgi:hypothetical protein
MSAESTNETPGGLRSPALPGSPCRGSEWLTRPEILVTVDRVESDVVYHHCVVERGARKGELVKMECSPTEWAESVLAGKLRPANGVSDPP